MNTSIALLPSLLITVAQASVGASADFRLPVPNEDERKRADAIVRAMYGKELARPPIGSRNETLSWKLIHRSRATDTDPPIRYALLLLARELALGSEESGPAVVAADELGGGFRVDPEATKLEVLQSLADGASTPARRERCFEEAIAAATRALRFQRFAGARSLVEFASSILDRAEPSIVARVRSRLDALESGQGEYRRAFSVLSEDARDGPANAIVGRYECFLLGQWAGGLPKLALSDEQALAELASSDLRSPTDASSRLALGDGWWQMADRQPEAAAHEIRSHAGAWYLLALPDLDGRLRARVLDRLATADPAPPMPREATKIDPGAWVIRERTGDRWDSEALSRTRHSQRFGGGTLRIRNTAAGNEIVKVAHARRVFEGSFTVWVEYRGRVKSVELCMEDGADRQLYVEGLPTDREWHVVTVRRRDEAVHVWIDGVPFTVQSYNAPLSVAALLSLRLDPGCELELRSFVARGGRPPLIEE